MKEFKKNLTIKLISISLSILLSIVFTSIESTGKEANISKETIDALTKIGQATAEIVEAVKPAVVNISTTRTIKEKGFVSPFFDDPIFRKFFGEPFRTPKERKSTSLGSGVIIDSNGYILTANHVIQGAEEIKVTLFDKREFKGKIIGTDAMTDIGVIKIDAVDLPTIKIGDSDKLRVGETVIAIGSPYGLTQTVTMGIVSATGRANVGIADYEDFIQTDAAINPGNSGGALVNVKGELIGINTAIFSTSGGYQGIGFAVPSNMAKAVMENLIKYGRVIRGWLGISIQVLTPELAKNLNIKTEKGVLVGDVVEGSPAEKAGIQRGDVITEYDGKPIEEPRQLRNLVAITKPEQEVNIKIIRDNEEKTIKVVISEMPSQMQKPAQGEYENLLRGVNVRELTPEIYSSMNIPKKIKGVIVSDIEEDSPAYSILMQGDIIQEINRQKVTNLRDYIDIVSKIKPNTDILLYIFRNGSSVYITIPSKD